jgi:hypothetical protein
MIYELMCNIVGSFPERRLWTANVQSDIANSASALGRHTSPLLRNARNLVQFGNGLLPADDVHCDTPSFVTPAQGQLRSVPITYGT